MVVVVFLLLLLLCIFHIRCTRFHTFNTERALSEQHQTAYCTRTPTHTSVLLLFLFFFLLVSLHISRTGGCQRKIIMLKSRVFNEKNTLSRRKAHIRLIVWLSFTLCLCLCVPVLGLVPCQRFGTSIWIVHGKMMRSGTWLMKTKSKRTQPPYWPGLFCPKVLYSLNCTVFKYEQ